MAAPAPAGQATAPEAKAQTRRKLTDLPPEVRLGVRVELARRMLPVASILVVVPDAGAYLDAINRWSVKVRFPVLIDDGSARSVERIAKFVRAFEPERVVRWAGDGVIDLTTAVSIAQRTATLDNIVARTWGADDADHLFQRWKELGFAPPGVVVASVFDRAWPAAIALAAGHGQPVVWLDQPPRGRLGAVLPADALSKFDATIITGLDKLGAEWRGVGDIIDSISICLNMPTKIPGPDGKPDEPLALTDRIGRHADSTRWGWAGMIFGDESESSWRAMCALFLQPRNVWLFNGYRHDKPPYNRYDIKPAASMLAEQGIRVAINDQPLSGLDDWRAHSRLGVDAGLILVNTSGSRRRFNLNPGRGHASDTPIMWKPAIVHFIHSFSAQNLNDRRSIAWLWLDRGAYAYAGSVEEPFLQAFQTPEALVQRLDAPAPWAVAARKKQGQVWRINIFGDPLITLGPPASKADAPDLAGARSVADDMRAALRDGDYESGLEALEMLGRDADAARLVRAILDEHPERITPTFAGLGWRPLLRTGQIAPLERLINQMDQKTSHDPELTDLLWLALRPALKVGDDSEINLLRSRLRNDSFADDVVDLGRAIGAAFGAEASRQWLSAMRLQAPNDRAREQIEKALKR